MTSSVIEASNTFFIVLLAVYAFRTERMTARKAVGCVVGFAGVLLVNLGGSATGGMSFSLGGEGLVFLSTISAAVSSNLSKRYSREHDPVLISGWQFVIGGATLLALGLAMGRAAWRPQTPQTHCPHWPCWPTWASSPQPRTRCGPWPWPPTRSRAWRSLAS